MSDNDMPKAEGFIRYKKIRGTHRMYCPIRERKVVLGKNREDGDIAYLTPAGSPEESNESWKRLDHGDHVAEVAEQEMQEAAGVSEGTLVIEEVGEEAYNVVNTATKDPINTSPISREEAEALVSGSPEEKKGLLERLKDKVLGNENEELEEGNKDDEVLACPLEGVEFGIGHDEYEACDECSLADSCAAAKAEQG